MYHIVNIEIAPFSTLRFIQFVTSKICVTETKARGQNPLLIYGGINSKKEQ